MHLNVMNINNSLSAQVPAVLAGDRDETVLLLVVRVRTAEDEVVVPAADVVDVLVDGDDVDVL